ncbi:hypothetical protein FRC02_001773 [Tulasnella sp. 418]|nr:hypothetical protein FRC02_001773 [Tulasnella sp. 418]
MHKYITVFALSALVAAQQVAACDAGYYRTWNNGWSCLPCQYGTYQPYNNYFFNSCTSVPAGYRANKDLAATARVACGGGKYSNGGGGVNSCLTCPAGTECPDQVNTSPKECNYGEYQPDAGSSEECKKCPKGSFSNMSVILVESISSNADQLYSKGAASCCQCCRGYYQDDTGKTSCDKCNSNRPYSKPGATTGSYNTNNGCFSLSTPPNPGPPTSCTQTRNPAGTCREFCLFGSLGLRPLKLGW